MFKLISGEFIIGSSEKDTEGNITVCDAMMVHFQPTPNGQLGINIFPINPFASKKGEEIKFNKLHILLEVQQVPEAISAEYSRITSGIITATSMPNLSVPNIK
jgi:hypothetical protein